MLPITTFTPLGIIACGVITSITVIPWAIGIATIVRWLW